MLRTVNKYRDYFAVTIITLIAQGYWVLNRGVHAETYWITRNWSTGFIDGFFYSDPSRPFMSLPFHLTYLLFGTSYTAIQFVYLLYAVCISLLTYELSKRLQVSRHFSLVAGLIAATHAGDQSNQLFSMVVVKQIVIIELIIAILLVPLLPTKVENRAKKVREPKQKNERNLLIFILSIIGLFTYESLAPVLFIMVIGLWLINHKLHKGILLGLLIWIIFTINRYFFEKNASYQSGKFRFPNLSELIQSVHSYISNGFNPFSWFQFYTSGIFLNCGENLFKIVEFPSIIAFAFLVVFLTISLVKNNNGAVSNCKSSRILMVILLLVGSYFSYLLVVDGVGNWRTQLLAIPWIAILIVLLMEKITKSFNSLAICIGLTALLAVFVSLGVVASLFQQLEYSARWDNHQRFFNSLHQEIIFPKPNSEFLVVNVPDEIALDGLCKSKLVDPFEDPYWFQASMNAYFRVSSNASYYLRKSQTNSQTLKVDNVNRTVMVQDHIFDIDRLILVEFKPTGKAKVLRPDEAFAKYNIDSLPPYQSLSSEFVIKPNALSNLKDISITRP